MNKISKILLVTSLVASASYAGGEIDPVQMTEAVKPDISLKLGTLGAGMDMSMKVNDSVAVRLNVNAFKYSDNRDIEGINYDYDLELLTVGGLVDYYLDNSNFRLTGGAYYNGNNLSGSATVGVGGININGTNYTSADIGSLDLEIEFDKVAPYLGIGWGSNNTDTGWSFSMDIGVMYHGEADIALSMTPGTAVAPAGLAADILAEANSIVNEVKDYKLYPVISIGATYRF